jgi:hypothetical protein
MAQFTLFAPFDKYSRRARIRPVLLASLPLALPVSAALPDLPRAHLLWSLALLSGVPLLADQLGRSRGKRIESRLFQSWGGKPSVQLLRWRGPTDRPRLAYLHARIQQITGTALRLPTESEERAKPEEADQIYDAAGLVLRARARGLPGAELVLEQNCEYGFRRNALGLRPYALVIAVAGLAAVVAWVFVPPGYLGRPGTALLVVLVVAEAALVVFWFVLVRACWAESAAWLYAERLLETCVVPDQGALPGATGN